MSLFSKEDLRLLEKTMKIREELTDNILSSMKDKNTKDVITLLRVIESMDRSIFSKAKLKIEDETQRNNEKTKEVLLQLLLKLHDKNETTTTNIDKGELLLNTDKNFNFREEEFSVGIDDINYEAFLKDKI